jgi:hypothetical protein
VCLLNRCIPLFCQLCHPESLLGLHNICRSAKGAYICQCTTRSLVLLFSKSNFSELTSSSTETNSKIHRQFRNAHEGHRSHAGLDPTRASTGVVWCTERAYEHGFADEPEKWANLGQGAPEVDDDIEGSFARPTEIDITMAGREYGPTAGIKGLRAAVANLYNVHHRKGKSSLYTWENVGRILYSDIFVFN